MQRVSLEIYTSVLEAVKIVTDVVDHKVELSIPAGSVLLDNILNLKIILEQAKKVGKEVDFITEDKCGNNLVDLIRGEKDEVVVRESAIDGRSTRLSAAVKLPSLKLPVIRLPFIAGYPEVAPHFAKGMDLKKLGLVLLVVILLTAALGFLFLSRQHKAEVTLYFSPQVLTKSVSVKVGDGLKADLDKKVLAGLKVVGTIEHSLTAVSTGTELEGEKASGKVTLYNPTLEAVTVKKNVQLTYKKDDLSYLYTTQEEVTVPAGVDTQTTITKGTVKVSVKAEAIGSGYNIKKDKELSVKGYKSSELTASSVEDFKGGSSKEVKVVTQADLTKLEQDLTAYVSKSLEEALKNRIPAGYTLLTKSEKIVDKNIVLNNKVGDRKDQLSGGVTARMEGLSYSNNELTDFIGKISQNVVPQGFEFHSYTKNLQVEVLGNTEKTVISPTEADLQVTFKFFIVPKVDKKKIFEKIAGLNMEDAVDELDKINDVEKAELKLMPNLLFFKKVPTNEGAVDIQIKVEE